ACSWSFCSGSAFGELRRDLFTFELDLESQAIEFSYDLVAEFFMEEVDFEAVLQFRIEIEEILRKGAVVFFVLKIVDDSRRKRRRRMAIVRKFSSAIRFDAINLRLSRTKS